MTKLEERFEKWKVEQCKKILTTAFETAIKDRFTDCDPVELGNTLERLDDPEVISELVDAFKKIMK